ncbi:MAG: helix-turn-helix domain-containing protein [Clostridia bacterium]|nr:helix-turn-helix domain-containing protein [Clostridia bacterium]
MLRIKQLRAESNMSQRALAVKLNCSQKAIDLWEKGITEPKADVVIALANIFECSADFILGREDDFGRVNVMRELSEGEKEFLELYSKLDKPGRDEAKNYIKYLISKN